MEGDELTRLRAENSTLRALLETAYRRVEVGVACDYVGLAAADWHDGRSPECAFAKWSRSEIDAMMMLTASPQRY